MKSMTGYGSCDLETGDEVFSVELKTINHRYKDFNIRAGKKLSPLEDRIRKTVSETMNRGHIDIFIKYTQNGVEGFHSEYDRDAAQAYMQIIDQINSEYPQIDKKITMSQFLSLPKILKDKDDKDDNDALWERFLPALEGALKMLDQARYAEGEIIKKDFIDRIGFLSEKITQIESLSNDIPKTYYEQLKKNISDYTDGIIDEDRIASELALYADRVNITEEIVRFRAHLGSFRKTIELNEPVGRKLDFTLQEINREANTIASKSNSFEISSIVVDIKAELEKIREQVQNIE